MTKTNTHPAGLLTDDETDLLSDPETNLDDHGDLRERIRNRLTEILDDCTILYPTLPADDLEAVFTAEDAESLAPIRAGTQDALAFLILGMLHGDDMLDTRLRDAIQNAGMSYGEEINVTLNLRRGPLPTLEQFAAQLYTDDKPTDETFPLFEHFLYQPGTDPDILADIASKHNVAIPQDKKADLARSMGPVERPPQTVITGVSVDEVSLDDDLESDT
jgi:hypothetical protein